MCFTNTASGLYIIVMCDLNRGKHALHGYVTKTDNMDTHCFHSYCTAKHHTIYEFSLTVAGTVVFNQSVKYVVFGQKDCPSLILSFDIFTTTTSDPRTKMPSRKGLIT